MVTIRTGLAVVVAMLALIALPSCALFQEDTEPASKALATLDSINDARLERELELVGRIQDPDAQAAWRAAAQADAAQSRLLTDELREWLDAIGDLDWRRLYEQARAQEGGS